VSTIEFHEDAVREREVRHRVGDWLEREARDGEFATTAAETVAVVEVPVAEVRAELERLVGDAVTPLVCEDGVYRLAE
jgi:hypothetical protein